MIQTRNFICIIALSSCFAQAQTASIDSLKVQIQGRLQSVEGRFAVAFKDMQTGQMFGINEKEVFHAASTIKTPIMIEVFKQAEAGKFSLWDSIPVKNEFKSIVDGSPFSLDISVDSDDGMYQNIGSKMTIYDLTYKMITKSSNMATNLLIDKIGAANANATMRGYGIKDLTVLRGMEDGKAFEKGLNNVVTAADLALVFEKLGTWQAVNPQASSEMLYILFDQTFNEIIPARLPKSVRVAHKTGSITGVQHDSGIVFLPEGKKYVVVLLSKQLKDVKAGVDALADVSEMIWKFAK